MVQKEIIKAIKKEMFKIILKDIFKRTLIQVMQETVEEIVVDGFFETTIQNLVGTMGGSDAAAHWLSVLGTTARETKMFTTLSGHDTSSDSKKPTSDTPSGPQKTILTQITSLMAEHGNADGTVDFTTLASEIQATMDLDLSNTLAFQNEQQKTKRQWLVQLVGAGVLSGISLLLPGLAGFSIYAISKAFSYSGQLFLKHANQRSVFTHLQQLTEDIQAEEIESILSTINIDSIGAKSLDDVGNVKVRNLLVNILDANSEPNSPFLQEDLKELKTKLGRQLNQMRSVLQHLSELKKCADPTAFDDFIRERREKGGGTFLALIEGLSLGDYFESGSQLPVRITRTDAKYQVGDLVVFKIDDSYVAHVVCAVNENLDGTVTYKTQGLNRETNPTPDSWELSGDQIVGIADFSEEFLATLPELASQGLLIESSVLAMINQFDVLNQKAQEIQDIKNSLNSNNKDVVFKGLINLMYEMASQRFTGDREGNLLKLETARNIAICNDIILGEVLTDYAATLYKQVFKKVFGPIVYKFFTSNPSAIKLDFEKLTTLTEIILCVKNFIHFSEAEVIISKSISEINSIVEKVWGEGYKYQRLNQEHRNSIEYFIIPEGYNMYEINELKANGIIKTKEEIIWNIKDAKIKMKQGRNFDFDPGKQDIWLALGDINYGLLHLLSGSGKTGHLIDFMKLDQSLNNPRTIAKFIYDRIRKGTGVIMNRDGIVVYAFKVEGQETVNYLAVHISGSEVENIGRLYTSFPVLPGTSNYEIYSDYFDGHPDLVGENVKVTNH